VSTLSLLDAGVLGIVEGLTEFLPVSSTGHLTIAEKILGLPIDDKAVTAYTAIIQSGAIIAVVIYFWRDLVTLIAAFFRGLVNSGERGHDYRMAWKVGLGSIPIGIVGFLARDLISGSLRNLWVVAFALIGWSVVMVLAERVGSRSRPESALTFTDAFVIGIVQCLALIPGVSRSGASISAGLFRGLDRVAATRISFLLSIPALLGAGLYELKDVSGSDLGVGPMVLGIVIAFIVAFASVAWLLRFVAHHPISVFVIYRVALGLLLIVLLAAGAISAT
jgi:undecaprenyl-diphosphatase